MSKCPLCGKTVFGSAMMCPKCGSAIPPKVKPPKKGGGSTGFNQSFGSPTGFNQSFGGSGGYGSSFGGGSPMQTGKSRKTLWIILSVAAVLILTTVIVIVAVKKPGGTDYDDDGSRSVGTDTEAAEEEAASYYEERAEVQKVTDLKKADDVMTEKEFIETAEDRGFDQAYFFAKADADGNMYDVDADNEITSATNEEHPVIEAFCYLDNDSIWHLYELDGEIMAYPVSYLATNDCEVPIIISESETIVSYDYLTKQYIRTIPHRDEVIVIVVDEINADTLMKLDISAEVAK